MKFLLGFVIAFLIVSQLSGQNEKLCLEIKKTDRGSLYVLKEGNKIIDSILLAHSRDVLVDYKVINKEKVFFIKKDFVGYFYFSFEKSNSVWKRSITTGQIGNNYASRSYIPPAKMYLCNTEYKILEEDRILIKNGESERIFECSTIADRNNAWLQKMEKLQKN